LTAFAERITISKERCCGDSAHYRLVAPILTQEITKRCAAEAGRFVISTLIVSQYFYIFFNFNFYVSKRKTKGLKGG
jgi:hypothetical protein